MSNVFPKSNLSPKKRKRLSKVLQQCNEDQITFFNRIYGGLHKVRDDQFTSAFNLCKRTLSKNQITKRTAVMNVEATKRLKDKGLI